jgi:hypothetical protein
MNKLPAYGQPNAETLYVIVPLSNPAQYESRYRLAQDFLRRMAKFPNVKCIVVEQNYHDREFAVTDPYEDDHIQLRGGPEHELWLKEGLINVGFRHLTHRYPGWRYAAWIDADVEFIDEDWVKNTIYALHTFRVVQPWSHSQDLGPNKEPLKVPPYRSFCSCYIGKVLNDPGTEYAKAYWHSGYAWAIRREVWDGLEPHGGLIDWCPMGSADHHMAWAFSGDIQGRIDKRYSAGYRAKADAFLKVCEEVIQRDIGFVKGLIVHHWHGKKRDRGYQSREQLLISAGFDPDVHLKRDENGLPILAGNNIALRDACRLYARQRNEDSIDVE